MNEQDFKRQHVYTKDIAAAASLIEIGCQRREQLPITSVISEKGGKEVIFWFEHGEVIVGGIKKTTLDWLRLLTCPWADFTKELSLDHQVAHLKAHAENRKVLARAAKDAERFPFRIIQQGNRVAVVGANVSEANRRRLLEG